MLQFYIIHKVLKRKVNNHFINRENPDYLNV